MLINKQQLISSFIKSLNAMSNAFPIIVGMLLLTSLMMTLFPVESIAMWFSQQSLVDAFIGAGIGSIAAGPPILSYLLGGEMLAGGISLFAVTAFIVSWVTVGIVQLPAEMLLLGKRFAIYRNLTSFVLAIIVAFVTVYTMQLLS